MTILQKGITMQEKLLLFGALLISGSTLLEARFKGSDFVIRITDESSLRPFKQEFKVYVNLTNNDKVSFKNLRMRNLLSDNLRMSSMRINGKVSSGSDYQTNMIQKIADNLNSEETIQISYTLVVGENLPDDDTGYHIENLMLQMYYVKELQTTTGVLHKLIPFAYVKPGCDTRFDVDRAGIPGELRADHVTATSYYDSSPPQKFGEFSHGWCAKDTARGQYLQILFQRKVRLTFLGIGGRKAKKDWVSEYQLRYKNGDTWFVYKENGFVKTFKGANNIHESFGWLLVKIHCEGVQIIPMKFSGKLVCLRAAIHGCYITDEGTCFKPIGMENGLIPSASLSDSMPEDDNVTTPNNGRLSKVVRRFPYGWMAANSKDWLQIDLGSLFKVTRVAIQGAHRKPFYITSFSFKYSNDSIKWITVKRRGSEKLQGATTSAEAKDGKIVDLPYAIYGRSFRIEPFHYEQESVLRTELYGCLAPTVDEYGTDHHTDHTKRSVLVDVDQGRMFVCQESISRTSCFQSEETDLFQTWRGLPVHISSIIGIDSYGNRYGKTKQGSYLFKKQKSDKWLDISNDEWTRQKTEGKLVMSVEIPEIMPNKVSKRYQWNLKTNRTITVSGLGIHVRNPNALSWHLKAKWACCGS